MTNNILELRNKAKELINTNRLMKSSYQENKDLIPAAAQEHKNKFLSDVTESTLKKLDLIKFENSLKIDKMKNEINKKKYPDNIEIQAIRSRAEALARQPLNFTILAYLDKAFERNEISFLYHFQDALKLNSEIPNELKLEINKKFDSYEKQSGIKKMELEMKLADAVSNQIDSYEKIIADDSNPDNKLMLIYENQAIEDLTNELNNL